MLSIITKEANRRGVGKKREKEKVGKGWSGDLAEKILEVRWLLKRRKVRKERLEKSKRRVRGKVNCRNEEVCEGNNEKYEG